MQHRNQFIFRRCAGLAVAVMAFSAGAASATEWRAFAGAQSPDLGSQALAFLPNELWIHAGDSIRWVHASNEIHTVTFLKPGQVRPPNSGPTFGVPVGCPGNTLDGAVFDGSSCVNSGIIGQGPVNLGPVIDNYSVSFPSAGNFKLVCLVHADMTGTIHVLDPAAQLPHDQAFYDAEAASQGARLFAETSGRRLRERSDSQDQNSVNPPPMIAGLGVIVTTGAGSQTMSLMRFLYDVLVVHVGDTVEWTNHDPTTPHTVTFGTEPVDPRPASQNVTSTPDGARETTISSISDSVNSGLLQASPQDRPNLAQAPAGVTRFRVTFTAPGTFNYICAIHDDLGMKGTVIVQ